MKIKWFETRIKTLFSPFFTKKKLDTGAATLKIHLATNRLM